MASSRGFAFLLLLLLALVSGVFSIPPHGFEVEQCEPGDIIFTEHGTIVCGEVAESFSMLVNVEPHAMQTGSANVQTNIVMNRFLGPTSVSPCVVTGNYSAAPMPDESEVDSAHVLFVEYGDQGICCGLKIESFMSEFTLLYADIWAPTLFDHETPNLSLASKANAICIGLFLEVIVDQIDQAPGITSSVYDVPVKKRLNTEFYNVNVNVEFTILRDMMDLFLEYAYSQRQWNIHPSFLRGPCGANNTALLEEPEHIFDLVQFRPPPSYCVSTVVFPDYSSVLVLIDSSEATEENPCLEYMGFIKVKDCSKDGGTISLLMNRQTTVIIGKDSNVYSIGLPKLKYVTSLEDLVDNTHPEDNLYSVGIELSNPESNNFDFWLVWRDFLPLAAKVERCDPVSDAKIMACMGMLNQGTTNSVPKVVPLGIPVNNVDINSPPAPAFTDLNNIYLECPYVGFSGECEVTVFVMSSFGGNFTLYYDRGHGLSLANTSLLNVAINISNSSGPTLAKITLFVEAPGRYRLHSEVSQTCTQDGDPFYDVTFKDADGDSEFGLFCPFDGADNPITQILFGAFESGSPSGRDAGYEVSYTTGTFDESVVRRTLFSQYVVNPPAKSEIPDETYFGSLVDIFTCTPTPQSFCPLDSTIYGQRSRVSDNNVFDVTTHEQISCDFTLQIDQMTGEFSAVDNNCFEAMNTIFDRMQNLVGVSFSNDGIQNDLLYRVIFDDDNMPLVHPFDFFVNIFGPLPIIQCPGDDFNLRFFGDNIKVTLNSAETQFVRLTSVIPTLAALRNAFIDIVPVQPIKKRDGSGLIGTQPPSGPPTAPPVPPAGTSPPPPDSLICFSLLCFPSLDYSSSDFLVSLVNNLVNEVISEEGGNPDLWGSDFTAPPSFGLRIIAERGFYSMSNLFNPESAFKKKRFYSPDTLIRPNSIIASNFMFQGDSETYLSNFLSEFVVVTIPEISDVQTFFDGEIPIIPPTPGTPPEVINFNETLVDYGFKCSDPFKPSINEPVYVTNKFRPNLFEIHKRSLVTIVDLCDLDAMLFWPTIDVIKLMGLGSYGLAQWWIDNWSNSTIQDAYYTVMTAYPNWWVNYAFDTPDGPRDWARYQVELVLAGEPLVGYTGSTITVVRINFNIWDTVQHYLCESGKIRLAGSSDSQMYNSSRTLTVIHPCSGTDILISTTDNSFPPIPTNAPVTTTATDSPTTTAGATASGSITTTSSPATTTAVPSSSVAAPSSTVTSTSSPTTGPTTGPTSGPTVPFGNSTADLEARIIALYQKEVAQDAMITRSEILSMVAIVVTLLFAIMQIFTRVSEK